MRRDPQVQHSKAELAFRHRLHHEREGGLAGDVEIESVHQQKRVSWRQLVLVLRFVQDDRAAQSPCFCRESWLPPAAARRVGVIAFRRE